MTKDQTKIKRLFNEYVDSLQQEEAFTKRIKYQGDIIIDLLTPAACKNILEADKKAITEKENKTDEEKEIERIIVSHLLDQVTDDGTPLLYKVGETAPGQKVGETIIELFNVSAGLLVEEIKQATGNKADLEDLQKTLESIKPEEIIERHKKVIKKVIAGFWDKESFDFPIIAAEDTEIELVKSIIPNNYFILNDKINKLLPTSIEIDGQAQPVNINSRNKKEITTTIILNYDDDNLTLSNGKNWTAYDRAVHNAVISLWEAGNRAFTPEMVYRAMNGLTGDEKISQTAVDKVEKSIDKSLSIKAKINCSEAVTAYKSKAKAVLQANLLEARKGILKTESGTKKTAYVFISEKFKPILYEYNQITKQIISVKPNLLQTKKALNTTEETIVIREYLLRRIEEIKNPKTQISNKIKFNSVIELLHIENLTKQKKSKIKDQIEKLLKHYVAINYIKGYAEYKAGRTIEGIEIKI